MLAFMYIIKSLWHLVVYIFYIASAEELLVQCSTEQIGL